MKVKYFSKNDLHEDYHEDFANEIDLNRFVLRKAEAFPENSSIHDLDMIVVSGKLTLSLNEQRENSYPAGSLIFIPTRSKIKMLNKGDEDLEIITARSSN